MRRREKVGALALAASLAFNGWNLTGTEEQTPLRAVAMYTEAHNAPEPYLKITDPAGNSVPGFIKRYDKNGIYWCVAMWQDNHGMLIARPNYAVKVWTEGSPLEPDWMLSKDPNHPLVMGSTRNWEVHSISYPDSMTRLFQGTLVTADTTLCIIRE